MYILLYRFYLHHTLWILKSSEYSLDGNRWRSSVVLLMDYDKIIESIEGKVATTLNRRKFVDNI